MRYTSATVVKSSFKLCAISGTLNTPKPLCGGGGSHQRTKDYSHLVVTTSLNAVVTAFS